MLTCAVLLLKSKDNRFFLIREEKEQLQMVVTELKLQVEVVNAAYKKLYERYQKHLRRLKYTFIRQHEESQHMERLMEEQSRKYCALVNSYSAITREHGILLSKLAKMTETENRLLDENEQLRKRFSKSHTEESLVRQDKSEAESSGRIDEKQTLPEELLLLQCDVVKRNRKS